MKRLCILTAQTIIAVFIMASCAEDTGLLGIYDEIDEINTSHDVFEVSTRSIPTGRIIADNTYAYLGKVIDPETGAAIEADFAAQFHCMEDYALPPKQNMIGEIKIDPITNDTLSIERGKVSCDSCEVRIYLKDYYGKGNNPMKLEVFMLDSKNILEETGTYYTDVDLNQYLASDKPIATKVFTAEDYIVSEADRENANYTDNIRIVLPKELGQQILEKGYSSPDSFKDSYHFIREVLPGLYFRISNGEGTMLTTFVSTFNIYYDYCDSKNPNTIFQGITRFAATPEVIQSTRFQNGDMDKLLTEMEYTYLKTPAGICTEMTLPVDEIFDQHPADSVSMAQIILTRQNKLQESYQLGTPSSLLMVRKQNMNSFFLNKQVSDNRTSYVTNFDAVHNTYSFTNICRLLAYCKHEKMEAAIRERITEKEWAERNPDWNKVVLVPVVISSNSTGNITSVNHDMGMNSVKLIGGDKKLQMQIIYTKFSR